MKHWRCIDIHYFYVSIHSVIKLMSENSNNIYLIFIFTRANIQMDIQSLLYIYPVNSNVTKINRQINTKVKTDKVPDDIHQFIHLSTSKEKK